MATWNEALRGYVADVPRVVFKRCDGSKFYFDINEKKDGPHGLVGGTTGSGKSEMIQSWILSMAIQSLNSPKRKNSL